MLKLHVPTKQYVLIDSITARGEATARMAKKNAYGESLNDLIVAFGRSFGIQQLKP